jgi:hypothetical protein
LLCCEVHAVAPKGQRNAATIVSMTGLDRRRVDTRLFNLRQDGKVGQE